MDRRPLDEDELALRDGVRDGAASVIASGEAALEAEWRDLEDDGHEWPVFVLRPSNVSALEIRWWMSPDPNWRRDDMVVAGFTFGDFSEGISGNIGASGRDSLVKSVAQCVRALVEGRASYEVSRADPDNYDSPITDRALELRIRWSFRTEHGSGSAVVRAYLASPEAFAALTGIPIAEHLSGKHAFAAFSPPR